jgi:alpha-1,3-rhamnosyl/mannosyltransferase
MFDRSNLEDHDLLICGLERDAVAAFNSSLPSHLKTRVITLDFIEEHCMPTMYGNAVAVLYPTLYEGFGLPVVESQASGTACIFSPVSSLKELVGPGAVTVPVDAADQWVAEIRRLAAQGGLDSQKAVEAKSWSQRYRWSNSIQLYIDLFESTLEIQKMKSGPRQREKRSQSRVFNSNPEARRI